MDGCDMTMGERAASKQSPGRCWKGGSRFADPGKHREMLRVLI